MSRDLDPCRAAVEDVEWARETVIAIFTELDDQAHARARLPTPPDYTPGDESVNRMMAHLLAQLNHHRDRET